MTQTFQVGDIVFVNPPSEEDKLFRSYEGFTDNLDDFVGHHAVIISVAQVEETVVRLVRCDTDYVFKMDDASTTVRLAHVNTRTSHLTLIRPSVLRICPITDIRLTAVGINAIPMAGSMISEGFSFLDGDYRSSIFDRYPSTIVDGALVDEVYLHEDGVGLLCYNVDAEEYDVNDYVFLIIPTHHVDNTQTGVSLFTTF